MELVATILGSSVLAAIVSGVFNLLQTRSRANAQLKDNDEKFQEGMKLLLLSSLKRDARDIIKSNNLTKDEYDAFMATYNAYKALGGDGWADLVKIQIETLKAGLGK